ncbi:MAG: ribonuclease E/G, partial [Candidatus Cloacimonetes bacterium]|nr:ribonuclease E/G [Candidatus Cloacimonadota bacterium]
YEATVKKTNMEAAAEIARQIRLRDLSGVIVVDFIDMMEESNKHEVLELLQKGLRRDRAKNKVYPFTSLGLVEVTRKRMRATLIANYSDTCPCCNGSGRVISKDAIIMRIYRWLSRAEYFIQNISLRINVHPELYDHIKQQGKMFEVYKDQLDFIGDPETQVDQFKVFKLPNMEEITSKFNA